MRMKIGLLHHFKVEWGIRSTLGACLHITRHFVKLYDTST